MASRNHLFLHISESPARLFDRLVKTYFSTKSFIPASGSRWTGSKKAVSKRILFLLDKNSESISYNEGLAKKMRFNYAEKLLSLRGYSVKNDFTLIWIMVSTSIKFDLNEKQQTKKLFPLTGMKHSIKNSFPLAGKTAFIVRREISYCDG